MANNDGNQWPTYPGPNSSGQGQGNPPQSSGGWTAPGWQQPAQGPRPGSGPGQPPPRTYPVPPYANPGGRSPGGGKGPVIAIIAILAVALLGLVAFVVAFVPRPVTTPRPPATAVPTATGPESPTSTPVRPTTSIPPAAPGQPPTGELKARIDQAYGTFEPIRHSGNGPMTIELPAEAAKGVI